MAANLNAAAIAGRLYEKPVWSALLHANNGRYNMAMIGPAYTVKAIRFFHDRTCTFLSLHTTLTSVTTAPMGAKAIHQMKMGLLRKLFALLLLVMATKLLLKVLT